VNKASSIGIVLANSTRRSRMRRYHVVVVAGRCETRVNGSGKVVSNPGSSRYFGFASRRHRIIYKIIYIKNTHHSKHSLRVDNANASDRIRTIRVDAQDITSKCPSTLLNTFFRGQAQASLEAGATRPSRHTNGCTIRMEKMTRQRPKLRGPNSALSEYCTSNGGQCNSARAGTSISKRMQKRHLQLAKPSTPEMIYVRYKRQTKDVARLKYSLAPQQAPAGLHMPQTSAQSARLCYRAALRRMLPSLVTVERAGPLQGR
jgi:hypothetical protein